MEEIKIYKKIELANAVMIGGWPGMGSVALGVVDYLRKVLGAAKFAEIKIDPLTTLDSVVVEDGIARLPQEPHNTFYYAKDLNLVIFEGEAQLPGQNGIDLLNKVLEMAWELKISRIYTGAAFPLPISYKDEPQVYGAANKKAMLNILTRVGIHPMEGGHISGLNGLVLGFAQARNIEAACLLATMPQYAISLPNPKASRAIINVLKKLLNLEIDLHDMDEFIKDMDERMAVIEDRVKDVLTIEHEEPESHPTEKKVPGYIMEKIEKLFLEAKADKSKATILKEELDRWDLYKLYEDRFLDLFKGRQ